MAAVACSPLGSNTLLCGAREKIIASVKQTWRDFEVVEESLNRQKASLDDSQSVDECSTSETADRSQACAAQQATARDAGESDRRERKHREEKPFLKKSQSSDEPSEEQPWSTGDMYACWALLQSLLSESVCASIAQLSRGAELCVSEESLPVVVPEEKEKRRSVHKCIRCLFPHLASVTQRGDGPLTIQLSTDTRFAQLCDVMPAHEAKRLLWYFHCSDHDQCLDLNVAMDRDERRKLHHCLHTVFGRMTEAKTLQGLPRNPKFPSFPVLDDGAQPVFSCIAGNEAGGSTPGDEVRGSTAVKPSFVQVRFRAKGKQSGQKRRAHERSEEKEDDGCVQFVLEKHNLEVLDALQLIATAVDAHLSDFSYAGLKDRRAVTKQFVTVRGVTHEQLRSVEDRLASKGVFIGAYQRRQQALRLGQLYANHFRLILRNVHCESSVESTQDVFAAAVGFVKDTGFINYYGPQRFGQASSGQSHHVGLSILTGNAKNAVETLLSPSDPDTDTPSKIDLAREHFRRTNDAKAALNLLPSLQCKDHLLLRALKRFGCTDLGYRSALLALPYASRLFYIQAYSSWLWNEAASHHIQIGGQSVLEGDLVIPRPIADDGCASRELSRDTVVVVTAEDVKTSRYSLSDVVLPAGWS